MKQSLALHRWRRFPPLLREGDGIGAASGLPQKGDQFETQRRIARTLPGKRPKGFVYRNGRDFTATAKDLHHAFRQGVPMRRPAVVLSACLALGLFSTLAVAQGPHASGKVEKIFLIPAAEGYGVGDCLSSGGECGQVVADAWCESQGFASAGSFGIAAPEDYTGAIEAPAKAADAPVRITCQD